MSSFQTPDKAGTLKLNEDAEARIQALWADYSESDIPGVSTPDFRKYDKEKETKGTTESPLTRVREPMRRTSSPLMRRASDGLVGVSTSPVTVGAYSGREGSNREDQGFLRANRGPTPPSTSSTSSYASSRSYASSQNLTNTSTNTVSSLAVTPPNDAGSGESGDAGRRVYGGLGSQDGSAKAFAGRRFGRVVSAPLGDRERTHEYTALMDRTRSGDADGTADHTGSNAGDRSSSATLTTSQLRRPPIQHTSSTSSLTTQSRLSDQSASSTDLSTPASAHSRSLSSATLSASTARRVGALARFGGPARRKQEFQQMIVDEAGGGGEGGEGKENDDRSPVGSSVGTPPSIELPTPPRAKQRSASLSSPPRENGEPSPPREERHLPIRISPSSRARSGTLPATILEDEAAESAASGNGGHLQVEAIHDQYDLLRSRQSSPSFDSGLSGSASRSDVSRNGSSSGRHRSSPSLPVNGSGSIHGDDGDKENRVRQRSSPQYLLNSTTTGYEKSNAAASTSTLMDRPPPQPLRLINNGLPPTEYESPSYSGASPAGSTLYGSTSTLRPLQLKAEPYRTPDRAQMELSAAISQLMPPPPVPTSQQYNVPADYVSRPAPVPPNMGHVNQAHTAPAGPPPTVSKRAFNVNGIGYEKLGVLGRGGTSKVYSVLCQTKHTVYALKKVDLNRADGETIKSYLNEIELLKRMKGHDRVIQLIDSEITFNSERTRPKALQLLMECGEIDFSSLLDEQRGKPLNMNFVGLYWQQMLQAVMAVHEQNVVHTDLKPANFVLVKGRLKIIDFGIAKAIANDTVNIHRDQQIGTVNYMSPEAIQRENGQNKLKLSYPSDVWSLGCILYQMIYGACPFQHVTGGPLHKMTYIANSANTINYPREATTKAAVDMDGKPISPRDTAVPVRASAIESMKGCLAYNKDDRMTIPELLQHEFLVTSGPARLPRKYTVIDQAQMAMMITYAVNASESERARPNFAAEVFAQLDQQNSELLRPFR